MLYAGISNLLQALSHLIVPVVSKAAQNVLNFNT